MQQTAHRAFALNVVVGVAAVTQRPNHAALLGLPIIGTRGVEHVEVPTVIDIKQHAVAGIEVIHRMLTRLMRLDTGEQNGGVADHTAPRLNDQFDVRTPSIETAVESLSGGNKQKVVIARELAANPQLLIASQPTRGVDVGSIEFIHSQIVAARDRGAAVLLVSAELDEVLGLSDRVQVMYDGRLVAEMPGEAADRDRIGRLMAGGDA